MEAIDKTRDIRDPVIVLRNIKRMNVKEEKQNELIEAIVTHNHLDQSYP